MFPVGFRQRGRHFVVCKPSEVLHFIAESKEIDSHYHFCCLNHKKLYKSHEKPSFLLVKSPFLLVKSPWTNLGFVAAPRFWAMICAQGTSTAFSVRSARWAPPAQNPRPSPGTKIFVEFFMVNYMICIWRVFGMYICLIMICIWANYNDPRYQLVI